MLYEIHSDTTFCPTNMSRNKTLHISIPEAGILVAYIDVGRVLGWKVPK